MTPRPVVHFRFPVLSMYVRGVGLLITPGMAPSAHLLTCFCTRNLQDPKVPGFCWLYCGCIPEHLQMVTFEMFLVRLLY